MNQHRKKSSLFALVAIALLATLPVYAASIDAAPHSGYGRINFNFDQPAKLRMSNSGTTATLHFNAPINGSAASIRSALPGYVTAAELSADKKTITLSLSKPYRIRQFVSGSSVGIDLVGAAASESMKPAPPEASEKPAAKPAMPSTPEDLSNDAATTPDAPSNPDDTFTAVPTTKPEVRTLAAAPSEKKAPAQPAEPTKKPKAETKPLPATAKPAASKPENPTKQMEPAKPTLKPEVKQSPKTETKPIEAAVASDPMLTTKPLTPTEPAKTIMAPLPEEKTTTGRPAAAPILTTKPAVDDDVDHAPTAPIAVEKPLKEKPEIVMHAPVVEAATKPAEPTKAVAAEEKTAAKSNEPFIVTARSLNSETILNFPWHERTAAAVFKRANHVWVVFSAAQNVNVPLLRTVMPRAVVNVTQYAYRGNTVLHFVTDGTLHARAVQVKNGYPWDIILSSTATRPTLDIPITGDSMEGQMRLMLGVFDVATPVRFYDPDAGDLVIILPTYENGRGVSNERNFPQFTVMSSNQGIAIISKVSDITTNQTRAGVSVGSKEGLAVSDNMPLLTGATATPVAGASTNSGVMMPYDQWFVPPEKYLDTVFDRLQAIAAATKATKADALMELVKLYLEDGRAAEAGGVLNLIASQYPDYYHSGKLALLSGASDMMMHHYDTANAAFNAPELANLDEAVLWREAVSLFAAPVNAAQQIQQAVDQQAQKPNADSAANTTPAAPQQLPPTPPPPAAKPVFHFLKYNKPYIRFYPPRVRQYLAVIAADAYIADGQEEKALAVFDTLIPDSIIGPVKTDAEYTLGMVALKKEQKDQALEIFDRLAKQTDNPYIAARARYQAALVRFKRGVLTADQAADIIQSTRMTWRSDALERQMLVSLIDLYKSSKRYDDVLRTQKALLETFPNDPEAITMSADMGELFSNIFLDGLADEMPPLKALSLFYEFRELTPIGDRGDQIIQRLADRLAAFDLLDRATQLLEHQIKFRVSGAARSQVGARLALLHLLNHHPQEALSVLEVTNYGGNTPELQTQRQQLTAEALNRLGKHEEALGILFNDTTRAGALLRLDILWSMQDWPNVVNRAEDILSERPNLTDTLTPQETEVLLKLALGYSFEGDNNQLRYLRDYYSGLIPDTAYKQIFDFITNDTTPLDPEDFAMLAEQISRTEGFLDTFKAKIAAGKLSEAVK